MSDETALSLDWFNLVLAVPLVLIAMALSWWQRLGLGKSLLIGAVRATVQLLLIGQVLLWLFTTDKWYLVLAVLLVMVVAATLAATNRVEQIGSRMSLRFLCGGAILIGSALTMAYLDLVVVNIDPWYDPRYLIPIFGMIVGNAMNGAALAAERVRSEFESRRSEIEAGLALGLARPRRLLAQFALP